MIERFLAQPDALFKGPYLTVPLPFRPGGAAGRPPFDWLAPDFIPHAHQTTAFARLTGETAQSTLVATGTGSGKTECFLFPILEHGRQARARGEGGIKAIILYPMNALAACRTLPSERSFLGRAVAICCEIATHFGEMRCFPSLFPYCGRNTAMRFRFHARHTRVHSP